MPRKQKHCAIRHCVHPCHDLTELIQNPEKGCQIFNLPQNTILETEQYNRGREESKSSHNRAAWHSLWTMV